VARLGAARERNTAASLGTIFAANSAASRPRLAKTASSETLRPPLRKKKGVRNELDLGLDHPVAVT